MKYFVATDLHGSAYWAQKVTEAFRSCGADVLVILGDVYNHGPRNPFPQDYAPMKVAETLSTVASQLIVIRGNCDGEVDQMISQFDFVSEASVFFENPLRRVFFTHGHVHNKNNLPHLSSGDVLVYGHFHKNEIVTVNDVICVNVSSCALPKDAVPAYCLIDSDGISVCDFDGKVLMSHTF